MWASRGYWENDRSFHSTFLWFCECSIRWFSLMPWTKGWRPDILSKSWGKAGSRTSFLSVSQNMMETLLGLPLFLGQDISHKLSPKQPPETSLPASTAQDTSLLQCGSLWRTWGTCLSWSYQWGTAITAHCSDTAYVKATEVCGCSSLEKGAFSPRFLELVLSTPPGDAARTPGSNPGNVTCKDCSVENTQKQCLLYRSFT